MNPQYINILVDRNVDKSLLRQALQTDISSYTKAYADAQSNSVSTLSWLYTHHRPGRSAGSIENVGAFPRSTEDQAQLLLESGFDNTSLPLADKLKSLLTSTLTRYVERLHIKVEHSTSVFCVADPYHVLAPGEVFLKFSTMKENPATKLKQSCIYDIDVLVGRNPAHLPSDMQKVRAVFRKELMNFADVAVFSSQGDVPLASLLSGGDYDGDTVFVCWDPSLVGPFVNAAPPPAISAFAAGLQCEAKPLNQIFGRCEHQEAFERSCDELLGKCVAFSLQPSLLGECVLEHEKVIYHGRAKLHEPNAVRLAALAGYLVDASKQGYSLSKNDWWTIRREVAGDRSLEEPAYRSGRAPTKSTNVIDWLKFTVAMDERDKALQNPRLKHDAQYKDKDLYTPWRQAHELALKQSDIELKNFLTHLRERLKELGTRFSNAAWSTRFHKDERGDADDIVKFRGAIEVICEDLKKITPASLSSSAETSITQTMLNLGPYTWNHLRASCLYDLYPRGAVSWYLAGRELCQIKANAVSSSSRTITAQMHSLMKLDQKLATRFIASKADVSEEQESRHSVEDDDPAVLDSWLF